MSKPANANIKLTVAYDGTHYLGWQKTNTGPSIEQTLEGALTKILQHDVHLQAASRTDAGVHAHGQVVNFITEKDLPHLDKFQNSINGLLPKDITIIAIEAAAHSFHPTLDCTGKEYHYHLCFDSVQMPHQRLYAWHYPYPLDVALMRECVSKIVGKRDFKAFCNAKKNEPYADHVRDLQSIQIIDLPNNCLRFELKGANFLYKMVRNIVGTLVYVGCGKIDSSDLSSILESADRTLAGMTAPAHGLFLSKVTYI